jgi:hypothetical protein
MDCGTSRLVHPYEYQTIGNSLALPYELSQTNGNQFSFTRLLMVRSLIIKNKNIYIFVDCNDLFILLY